MEEKILEQAIIALKQQKRPELIECPVYGQYSSEVKTFIYDDADRRYDIQTETPDNKKVRSVKAFAKIITEELRRRENFSGNKATVSINLSGGTFIPDDNFGNSVITFERLNSQQWKLIKSGINTRMDHKQFLLFLQGLKPSIAYFTDIFKNFATLRMIGRTELTSNPTFTEDGQNSGYTCNYKLEDGTTGEEKFPTGFVANVQFAKAGDKSYDIPIDLLFTRNEDDEIEIEVLCPEFENIEERAIIDEAEYIKQETKSLDYINEEENNNLYNIIKIEDKETNADILDLKKELENLEEEEKKIIYSRYYMDMTQTETSKELGISQVQVYRKENKIFQKLKNNL